MSRPGYGRQARRKASPRPFEVARREREASETVRDYVCGRCMDEGRGRHILGRFILTASGEFLIHSFGRAFLPEDAGRPDKALLYCDLCRLDEQVAEDRVRHSLVEQRAAGIQRYVEELRGDGVSSPSRQ